MKRLWDVLAPVVLAIWMMLSLAVAGVVYVGIKSNVGNEEFWHYERSLGGFTIHLTKNISMDILWFQILTFLPVLILMATPAVWIVRRRKA